VSNIREVLWEKGVTTQEEYLLRLYFYGNLNKVGGGSLENMDFKDELMCRAEEISDTVPDYQTFSKGSKVSVQDFGWKEGYDREMRDYLNRGYESFNIYDE